MGRNSCNPRLSFNKLVKSIIYLDGGETILNSAIDIQNFFCEIFCTDKKEINFDNIPEKSAQAFRNRTVTKDGRAFQNTIVKIFMNTLNSNFNITFAENKLIKWLKNKKAELISAEHKIFETFITTEYIGFEESVYKETGKSVSEEIIKIIKKELLNNKPYCAFIYLMIISVFPCSYPGHNLNEQQNYSNFLLYFLASNSDVSIGNIEGMAEIIKKESPNVFLTNRDFNERSDRYPFYQMLYDVKRITLLNFASTSFIAGAAVNSIYESTEKMKHWFQMNLINGEIEADIIITYPHCNAAYDAARYKMYPRGRRNVDIDKLILFNVNMIIKFKEEHPKARINIYFTKIALPYAVLITEHKKNENNYMKIDMYGAVISDDLNRPTFYLMESNFNTKQMYDFFRTNVLNIRDGHSFHYLGHPELSWMFYKKTNRHIIHRAVIEKNLQPHTQRAYEECIKNNYPIEIDLLQMSDGTIVVGRDDYDISVYGYNSCLSKLTLVELKKINEKAGDNKILTLEELLDLVNGKIPLLIEIKTNSQYNNDKRKEYAKNIVELLHKYNIRIASFLESESVSFSLGYAIHSSDPYILKAVKDIDMLIPCGIILSDFSYLKDKMDKAVYNIHTKKDFKEVFKPDFVSCNIEYIEEGIKICKNYDIPLFAWTIKEHTSQDKAYKYKCDNIIIEGAKLFDK